MESAQTSKPLVPPARPVRSHGGHVLGPLCTMAKLDTPIGGRIYAAGVLAGIVALFVMAARLHPDGLDYGTHQQLGLPPCGFLVMTGLPCPTCGMTTAFSYTIHGQILAAIHAQFAGFIATVVLMVIGVFALNAVVTGRRPAFNWYRVNPVHVVWVGCALFIVAWGVKILICPRANGSAGRPHY